MINKLNLPVNTLPSRGYGYKFKQIEIPSMVFSEILAYQGELESCKNESAEFITLLKHIVLPLKHGADISMYDAIPIIAVRIYNSSAETLTDFVKIKYTCPVHQKKETLEVKLSSFKFNDMAPLLKKIKSVRIQGKLYEFKIPTVRDFLYITDMYRLKVPVESSLKYFYLLSMFKAAYEEGKQLDILNALKTATSKDIVTMNTIYKLLTGAFTGFMVTCNHESEPVAVRIENISPVTDIFQNILCSENLDEAAFDLRKDDED